MKILRARKFCLTFVIFSLIFGCYCASSYAAEPEEYVDLTELQRQADRENPQAVSYISALTTNAKLGDVEAQNMLGHIYHDGRWAEKNLDTSKKYFLMAAEQGDMDAKVWLVEIYQRENNPVQSLMWLKLRGVSDEDLNDWMPPQGVTPEQIEEAKRLADEWKLTPSAAVSIPSDKLVKIPDKPKRVPISILSEDECKSAPTEAEFLRLNAEGGDLHAQFALGFSYIEKDTTEAIKWIRKAAEQGYETAQVIMGKLYASDIDDVGPYGRDNEMRFAKKTNLPVDHAAAAEWFRKSAEQGNRDAQYFLGLMLRDGLGIKQDYEEVYLWIGLGTRGHTKRTKRYANVLDDIKRHLSPEQIAKIDARIKEWKPFRVNFRDEKLSINFFGLLCGKSDGPQVVDSCGDIVRVIYSEAVNSELYVRKKQRT